MNVTGGEIIRFTEGEKSFAWNFDGPIGGYAFDLKQIAPADVLDHSVRAYVNADPYYAGGR